MVAEHTYLSSRQTPNRAVRSPVLGLHQISRPSLRGIHAASEFFGKLLLANNAAEALSDHETNWDGRLDKLGKFDALVG